MASSTPNLALPYPQSSDAANPPADFYALASRIEAVVTSYYVSSSAVPPSPAYAGLLWYQTNTGYVYLYTSPSTSYLVSRVQEVGVKPHINLYIANAMNISTTLKDIRFDTTKTVLGGSYAPALQTLGTPGRVTISKDGVYQINGTVSSAATVNVLASIVAAGTTYNGVYGASLGSSSANVTVALSANDVVYLQAVASGTSAISTGDSTHSPTSMQITYLGPLA